MLFATMEKSKTCFVISPIGAADSPQRKRADTVLKHIFKPVLDSLGYEVVRADEISTPGSITLQVIERVLESQIVIADLTDHNPNVFYELAVRHASQLPVIHVIAAGQPIPFDVADLRTIPVEIDLDGAEKTRTQIAAQVKEIEAGHHGETPVKLAGVLKHVTHDKSEDKVLLRQILNALAEIKSDLRASTQPPPTSLESGPEPQPYSYTPGELERISRRVSELLSQGNDRLVSLDVTYTDHHVRFIARGQKGVYKPTVFPRKWMPLNLVAHKIARVVAEKTDQEGSTEPQSE